MRNIQWIKNCVECSAVFLSRFATHSKFCEQKCARRHNTKKYIIKRRETSVGRQLTLLSVCNKCGLHPKYRKDCYCLPCINRTQTKVRRQHAEAKDAVWKNQRTRAKLWKKNNPEKVKFWHPFSTTHSPLPRHCLKQSE